MIELLVSNTEPAVENFKRGVPKEGLKPGIVNFQIEKQFYQFQSQQGFAKKISGLVLERQTHRIIYKMATGVRR